MNSSPVQGTATPDESVAEDDIKDEYIPYLEEYEQALWRGEDILPQQWLIGRTPEGLRELLTHVYRTHRRPSAVHGELPETRAGVRVGNYELIRELGRGGMGVVYLARHVQLNRHVALKMILAGRLSSPAEVERFRIETMAAANLSHPHIVTVHEVGDFEGQHFFTMSLIEGMSVRQHLDAGAWANDADRMRKATRLIATAADAVHYAHQHGVIHRDLKPANILLDAHGQPFVTDFGLAKLTDVDNQLTETGAVVGTPGYIAPEQARGEKSVTVAADIHALGAIFYELLTGQPPFRGKTVMETLWLVQDREPRQPRAINAHVPRDLETICLKCLEKKPDRRYASAQALGEDLGLWLAGKPINARRAGVVERAIKWARRRPGIAAAAAAFVVVLGVCFALVLGQWRRAERESEQNKETLYFRNIVLSDSYWFQNRPDLVEDLLGLCPTDLRSWEWHFLKRRTRRELLVLVPTVGHIQSAAFTADGQRILTVSTCGVISGWDAKTGAILSSFKSPDESSSETFVSPGGDSVAMFSPDKTFRVRSSDDGRLLCACNRAHIASVDPRPTWSVTRIATPGADGAVHVWDIKTGEEVWSSRGGDEIAGLSFSPDGRILCVHRTRTDKQEGGPSSSLEFRNAATGQLLPQSWSTKQNRAYHSFAFHPDNRHLAAFDGPFDPRFAKKSELVILDLETGDRDVRVRHLSYKTGLCEFTPDGLLLAGSCADNAIRLWDIKEREEKLTLHGTRGHQFLAFSPQGDRLASNDTAGTLRVWDLRDGQQSPTWKAGKFAVASLAVSPRGDWLVSGSYDGTLRKWDIASGAFQELGSRLANIVHGVAVDSKATRIAAACRDGTVHIYDADDGRELLVLREHDKGQPLLGVAFSPEGRRVISIGQDRKVIVWDAGTGILEQTFTDHQGAIKAVSFSSDGTLLLTASEDGMACVRDGTTGQVRHSFIHKDFKLTAATLSPNGRRVVTAGQALTGGRGLIATLWDAATGSQIEEMRGHDDDINAVAFTRDGQRFVTASKDHTIRLWDGVTGRDILKLNEHLGAVEAVVFDKDGRLWSAGWDATIKMWDGRLPD